MNVIWKTALSAADVQEIDVPEGAELLTAREQHGLCCVWFSCDPDKPMTKRRIAIVGTGYPVPEGGIYIGTCFVMWGQLVFHIFETGEVSPG